MELRRLNSNWTRANPANVSEPVVHAKLNPNLEAIRRLHAIGLPRPFSRICFAASAPEQNLACEVKPPAVIVEDPMAIGPYDKSPTSRSEAIPGSVEHRAISRCKFALRAATKFKQGSHPHSSGLLFVDLAVSCRVFRILSISHRPTYNLMATDGSCLRV